MLRKQNSIFVQPDEKPFKSIWNEIEVTANKQASLIGYDTPQPILVFEVKSKTGEHYCQTASTITNLHRAIAKDKKAPKGALKALRSLVQEARPRMTEESIQDLVAEFIPHATDHSIHAVVKNSLQFEKSDLGVPASGWKCHID